MRTSIVSVIAAAVFLAALLVVFCAALARVGERPALPEEREAPAPLDATPEPPVLTLRETVIDGPPRTKVARAPPARAHDHARDAAGGDGWWCGPWRPLASGPVTQSVRSCSPAAP